MDHNSSQTTNGIGWQDHVEDNTRNTQTRTELTDEEVDEEDIVPQVIGKVVRNVRMFQNTLETLEAEENKEMIRTRFTPDVALKLTMAQTAQSMKIIQTEEFFWNGMHEICCKMHKNSRDGSMIEAFPPV